MLEEERLRDQAVDAQWPMEEDNASQGTGSSSSEASSDDDASTDGDPEPTKDMGSLFAGLFSVPGQAGESAFGLSAAQLRALQPIHAGADPRLF